MSERNTTNSQTVRLIAVGDMSFNGRWRRLLRSKGPQFPNHHVAECWRNSDVRLANLESPVTARPRVAASKFVLRGSSEATRVLTHDRFDAVTLANNHQMDFGIEGLVDTRQHLSESGVLCHGAGETEAQANSPLILEKRGVRIGLLAYCDVFQRSHLYAHKARGGVARLDGDAVKRSIALLRKDVDWLVLQLHWGDEYCLLPSPAQRNLARELLREGADMIVGHHPHVVQPFELIDGKPVFYSLGNWLFSDDYWRGVNGRGEPFAARYRLADCTGRGAWAEVVLSGSRRLEASMHLTVRNRQLQPVPVDAAGASPMLLSGANDVAYKQSYERSLEQAASQENESQKATGLERIRLHLANLRLCRLPYES